MTDWEELEEVGPFEEMADRLPAFITALSPIVASSYDWKIGLCVAGMGLAAEGMKRVFDNIEYEFLEGYGGLYMLSPRIQRQRLLSEGIQNLY